jgi:hypothetical protein
MPSSGLYNLNSQRDGAPESERPARDRKMNTVNK